MHDAELSIIEFGFHCAKFRKSAVTSKFIRKLYSKGPRIEKEMKVKT